MSSTSSKNSEIIKLCFLLREFYNSKVLSIKDKSELNLLFNLIEERSIDEWSEIDIDKFSSLNRLGIYVSSRNGGTLEIKDDFSIIGKSKHTFLYYDKDGIHFECPLTDVNQNNIFCDDKNQIYIGVNGKYYMIYPYRTDYSSCENITQYDFDFPFTDISFTSRDEILEAVKAKENIKTGKVNSKFAHYLCSIVSNYIYHLGCDKFKGESNNKTITYSYFENEEIMRRSIDEITLRLFLKYCECRGNFECTSSSFNSKFLRQFFGDTEFRITFDEFRVYLTFVERVNNDSNQLLCKEHCICKIENDEIVVYPLDRSYDYYISNHKPYVEPCDDGYDSDPDDIFNHGGYSIGSKK